jgi:hypothetical protein
MPEVAAFVRSVREVFGDAVIDDAIKLGKSEEPAFYACENGRIKLHRGYLSVTRMSPSTPHEPFKPTRYLCLVEDGHRVR